LKFYSKYTKIIKKSVTTSQGKKAKLFVCATNNGSYVDVSLKGQPGEDIMIRGYVAFFLEEANQYEAWVEVAAHRPGLWEDSRISSKDGRLYFKKNGTLVRVIAKIYADANYKYLIDTASTNAFQR